MKRKNSTIILYSFGEYSAWNRESKSIPKILDITTEIKAEPGTEFGYVLHIKQGKGETLTFKIDHLPFSCARPVLIERQLRIFRAFFLY